MFFPIFPLVLISKLAEISRTWLLSTPFAFSESSFLLHSHGQTVGNWSCSRGCSCLDNKPKCFSAFIRARTRMKLAKQPEHSVWRDTHTQMLALQVHSPEEECFRQCCTVGTTLASPQFCSWQAILLPLELKQGNAGKDKCGESSGYEHQILFSYINSSY